MTTKAISLCQCNCIAYVMYIFTVRLLTTHIYSTIQYTYFSPFSFFLYQTHNHAHTHTIYSLYVSPPSSRLPFCKYRCCIYCFILYYYYCCCYYFSFILLLFIFCYCCLQFSVVIHLIVSVCVCVCALASKRRISSHLKRCHFYGLLSLVFGYDNFVIINTSRTILHNIVNLRGEKMKENCNHKHGQKMDLVALRDYSFAHVYIHINILYTRNASCRMIVQIDRCVLPTISYVRFFSFISFTFLQLSLSLSLPPLPSFSVSFTRETFFTKYCNLFA